MITILWEKSTILLQNSAYTLTLLHWKNYAKRTTRQQSSLPKKQGRSADYRRAMARAETAGAQ